MVSALISRLAELSCTLRTVVLLVASPVSLMPMNQAVSVCAAGFGMYFDAYFAHCLT